MKSTTQLSQLWIYPIKSLGGISLSTSRVLPKGLEFDRRWMLVDENDVFMTQRTHPEMALLKLSIDTDYLTVTRHSQSITIPLKSDPGKPVETKVFDDPVVLSEVSANHNAWFSEMLGVNCKLLFFPERNPRPIDPEYAINDDHVSLADGYPFLIIGQSSLDDLNGRLEKPVPMNRFRPNFVFTGGTPYEEDTWQNFTIGSNQFVGVKPCARCVIPTIDQETAKKSAEPSKTLAAYRQRNNKIYYGQNVIALDYSSVSVGDVIGVVNVNGQ